MKIGILTFQHSINFGAQLQCFALQEYLKEIGHEPQVIQYYPYKRSAFYRGVGVKKNGLLLSMKYLILKFLYADRIVKRFNAFKTKYIELSSKVDMHNIGELANRYDAIIVGSDQVWGFAFHEQPIYFFGWQPEYKGRRISYAPCSAKNFIKDENKENIRVLLSDFHYLSVRNIETQQFVEDLIDKKVPIVLDPTFLIDFSKYKFFLKKPFKKYILVYIIGDEIAGGHNAIVHDIKEKRGNMPVVSVVLSEGNMKIFSWVDKTYWYLDPFEWLSLIANADYFYTDSFHGVVFALKFGVDFLAYYVDPDRASRFIDLANRFYLEDHIVNSVGDAVNRSCIKKEKSDFRRTNDYINLQIQVSKDFLNEALKLNK